VFQSSGKSRIDAPLGSVPEGIRIYVIGGGIHGRLDLLDEVLAKVAMDVDMHPASNAIRVFLGDYIDRGPRPQARARPADQLSCRPVDSLSHGKP
jgi:hypothetical protein